MLPGAFLVDNFLNDEDLLTLIEWARKLESDGHFRPAAIGKNFLKQQNRQVRSDHICWVDPTLEPESQLVFKIFQELMAMAKRELLLPVKRFECHFAKYESGSFYLPHRDRHKTNPSRLLTCVIYLNDLLASDGGTLILYGADEEKVEVQPRAGSLVFFDSQLLHEVKQAHVERWTLTGWMRDDIHPALIL